MSAHITKAARDAAADLSLACFPESREVAEWLRRGDVSDDTGRTADENSPWTLAFAKAIAEERASVVAYLRMLSDAARSHHGEVCLQEDDEILDAIITRMEAHAFSASQIEKGVHDDLPLNSTPKLPDKFIPASAEAEPAA
jgi:hypothetical protein